MAVITLSVNAHKLSYVYRLDGTIVPYINILPPISLPDGNIIRKFPIISTAEGVKDIAQRDRLTITVPEDKTQSAVISITEHSDLPRKPLHPTTCPVCGEPLFPSAVGMGRCLNRCCMGQMAPAILLFLSSIGVAVQYPFKKILDNLLARGSIRSLVDIFKLEDADLIFDDVTPLEARAFQQYVHSVRGSVTVNQLLNGLRVPQMTRADTDEVYRQFAAKKYTLKQLPEFFDTGRQMEINIKWDGWNELVSLELNREVIAELCQILYL